MPREEENNMEEFTFRDLNLNKPLLNALDDLGYTIPTTIQGKAFSVVMSGKDMIGIAQTGTGKTLAYLLPALRQWNFSKDRLPQILIIVPTRELVAQIVETVEQLTTYMTLTVVGVYGGTNIHTQADQINMGLDVLVATPGRLLDLALRGDLVLKGIKRLIVDEVDEMFDLGFKHQLLNVLDLLPEKKQSLFFSATMNEQVEELIDEYFVNPVKVEAAPAGTPLENIHLTAYSVPNFNTKLNLLEDLLATKSEMEKVLVFVSSKTFAMTVYERLLPNFEERLGVIHSNKSQNNRFETVNAFQSGEISILIATDLISRGIDITGVTHVVNFDAPDDFENFIHRVGRTGRADRKGEAISFFSPFESTSEKHITEGLGDLKLEYVDFPESVEISNELIYEEEPRISMPEPAVKIKKREDVGPAFHEKSAKNSKVNVRKDWKKIKQEKYGRPKKKGQKKK
jgi:ATP-dependent RNA helicase RhlE